MPSEGHSLLDSLPLRITVEALGALRPHEETRSSLVADLAGSLRTSQLQLDPVMADRTTGVVLDGMHRLAALRLLGCTRVVVCFVNYRNSGIRVKRWFRLIPSDSATLLRRLVRALRLHRAPTRTMAVERVDRHQAAVALLGRDGAFVSSFRCRSPITSHGLVRLFDRISGECGRIVEICSERDAFARLSGGNGFVLYPSPISKEDVRNAGLFSRLFPAKSTHHGFPVRPVSIRFPLGHLSRAVTDLSAQHALKRILTGVAPKLLPSGVAYQGRVYEEPLLRLR